MPAAFPFRWVLSSGWISPRWIIGLKSNIIFMTIKISFQMAFKKIIKIYTAQPAIWPGLQRAWPGHSEVWELRAVDPARRGPASYTDEPLHATLTRLDSQDLWPWQAPCPAEPGPQSGGDRHSASSRVPPTTSANLRPTWFLPSCLL